MICHNNIKPNMELGNMISIIIFNQILISLPQQNGLISFTGVHLSLNTEMVALGDIMNLLKKTMYIEIV